MVGLTVSSFGVYGLLVVIAILYQTELPRMVKLGLGIGRTLEPLGSFPYTYRRIQEPRLEACEDMWLSESTRQLFLACSDSLSRKEYLPNGGKFNVSGRSLRDSIVVMDLERPSGDSFDMRTLETPGFFGTDGDGRLHLVGFAGSDDEPGDIRLWVINTKPSVDPITGEFLDNSKVGANSTVELFKTGAGATTLEHIKTFFHSQIATPNKVTALGGPHDGFYYTNDHGTVKTGLGYALSPLLAKADVSFCDDTTCRTVVPGLKYPNGLVKGHDGLIYVPSASIGGIDVFEPLPDHGLKKIDHIDVDYSLDNLNVDASGDIYAAAFPIAKQILDGFNDPLNSFPAATALRIRKTLSGYEVTKVIEDRNGEVLPATTTVLHDTKTGKLFMSSVFSPFISICDEE
ncbi:uncharacterized protein BCR38DRAFT_377014 [Pseudomassariella vexata]|uniref:Serum paraoxonase/arylesterase n=1 Tax=Pseudomassariella vexata TaxID=1141098 RepID=A0A1Y2DGI6_9PEZI|nr:uncharacterized protein BCR38DRAFT_377014 [Pseudomassariella vexata]ORY58393.1 hypothetical protein BCR38DRAFT_377014 [Pseudomassariella vexata]